MSDNGLRSSSIVVDRGMSKSSNVIMSESGAIIRSSVAFICTDAWIDA